MRRRLAALVLVTACGSSPATVDPDAAPGADAAPSPVDAAPADAGDRVPDAAPPAERLERVDWTTTRGEPLAATAVTLPYAGDLYAVGSSAFATRSACTTEGSATFCTYTWHDDTGGIVQRRERLIATTGTVVSPDGRSAMLFEADEVDVCGEGESRPIVARGTLLLLELATGAARLEAALRTNLFSAQAFTPDSSWFLSAPIPDGACGAASFAQRSASAPFGPAAGLSGGLDFVQAIDANRWFAYRGHDLGVVDPRVPGSFRFLGDSPYTFHAAGGWVHVYNGFGDLAQDVVSLSPTGTQHETTLRDEDWHAFASWGRWIRVCRYRSEDSRACRVADALAERPHVDFDVTHAPDHLDDTVLIGRDGAAVVFVGPNDEGRRTVQRVDLLSGEREILHAGDGKLRPLGDGHAALLEKDGAVWLLEADRQELLAEGVTDVLTTPPFPVRHRVRQDELAVLTLTRAPGQVTLVVLDVRTRRLVTLTDRLHHAPHRDFPLGYDDCGQAFATRHAGAAIEGLIQDGSHFFFVEEARAAEDKASLWLLPVDLSAPPRKLAELSHPVHCNAPLSSPDGTRVGFAEDGFDGASTRFVFAPLP